MPTDVRGLAITAASDGAADAYDHAISGYLTFRADAGRRVGKALAADPDFALAHVLSGYFSMLSFSARQVPAARDALATARRHAPRATRREQAHVDALNHWVDGDLDRALATWNGITQSHPRDVLAVRLHHFNAFWLGRPETMLAAVEAVLPHWSPELPGYGTLLACRAFACEECGSYTVAEAAGRAAIALDPGDLWATHAVAHVMEMQGRRGEGIAFLDAREQHWQGGNNLTHHLWWHRALFHLERQDIGAVLDLYDRRFRDLGSPLVTAIPDLYIDMQNAASMLFRLELRGVPVGDRWVELADKAEARIGDHLSPFTVLHWMMALAATARWEACTRLLDALRETARANDGTIAATLQESTLPVCEAILAHRRGEFAGAVAAMRPALGVMYRMGGSHAQQEVLDQLFLDAAQRAGLDSDARLLLERAAGRHPVPPERRAGYAEAARRVRH